MVGFVHSQFFAINKYKFNLYYLFKLTTTLYIQGVELGPLEIQINSLQKSIEAEQQEIAELQQMWLRDQSELVRLSKEKETQTRDVENLKKQLTILSQKKLRTEGSVQAKLDHFPEQPSFN